MRILLNIDRLDAQLLEILARDARTGVVELSSALGISRNTVQSRLKRLEHSGLITGYRVTVDLSKAGVAVEAFIALEIEQGRLTVVVDSLAEVPQVLEVHATTGREDLLVRVGTPTQAGLQQLIERIIAIDGVTHSNTTLALTTPLPFRAQPLLEELTHDAGWGRSTPAPKL